MVTNCGRVDKYVAVGDASGGGHEGIVAEKKMTNKQESEGST